MTNKEAATVLRDLKRDAESKLMGDDFDDVFQNYIQALNIAINVINESIAFKRSTKGYQLIIENYDNAVDNVLDKYLSKKLVATIMNEITLELAKGFDTKLS